MGCGISGRGPTSPLYTNEFSPPIHELVPIDVAYPETFPPSGIIKSESGYFFDDREFIKQCQIIHIHEIIVYTESYISGLEILYYLDGSIKSAKHCGPKNGKKYSMPISNSDSILICEVTYNDNRICSIKFETIEGRVLEAICEGGKGKKKTTVNLKPDRRAVVAFKGKVSEYLEGFSAYSWRLCGRIR